MPHSVFAFRWSRPANGVRVIRSEGTRIENGEPLMRDGVFLVAQDRLALEYEPLARGDELLDALLGAAKAEEPDPEVLAALASEWGILGLRQWWVKGRRKPVKRHERIDKTLLPDGTLEIRELPNKKQWDSSVGESIEDWAFELRELRDAALLALHIREGDAAYFAERVLVPPITTAGDAPERFRTAKESPRLHVVEGSASYYIHGRPLPIHVGGAGNPRAAALIYPDAPLRAAALVLGQILKARLTTLATYGPSFDAAADVLEPSRVRPRSLLGAAWLLLDDARAGDSVEVRRCLECRMPFIANPANERGHPRKFCPSSEICRKRYDKRKRSARELAKAGEHPAVIAKRLRRDVSTVRTWLREGSRNEGERLGRKKK